MSLWVQLSYQLLKLKTNEAPFRRLIMWEQFGMRTQRLIDHGIIVGPDPGDSYSKLRWGWWDMILDEFGPGP